jgi:phosphatidylglycerophosphatase A
MAAAPSLLDRAALALATLGPVGRIPHAPGTWGAAAALAASPWCLLPLPLTARLGVLCGVLLAGTWAAGRAERVLGDDDPGCVVIDEVLGQWTALTPFFLSGWDARTPWELLGLFALFRLFDIAKPWPIRAVDRNLRGGLGVMLDDLIAGACAAAALALIRLFL